MHKRRNLSPKNLSSVQTIDLLHMTSQAPPTRSCTDCPRIPGYSLSIPWLFPRILYVFPQYFPVSLCSLIRLFVHLGLYPDNGSSHFLPRLRGELGTYLGLTASRLKGEELIDSGLATHFITRRDGSVSNSSVPTLQVKWKATNFPPIAKAFNHL